jgi:hypothetical protein
LSYAKFNTFWQIQYNYTLCYRIKGIKGICQHGRVSLVAKSPEHIAFETPSHDETGNVRDTVCWKRQQTES